MEVIGIKLMALDLAVSDCHKGIRDNRDLIEEVENRLESKLVMQLDKKH
jgi:hypothetical protein